MTTVLNIVEVTKNGPAQIKNIRTGKEFFVHQGGATAYRISGTKQVGACMGGLNGLGGAIGKQNDEIEVICTKFKQVS